MENVLTNYLDKRLREEKKLNLQNIRQGPVITLSREVGCNGLTLARKLAQKLNHSQSDTKWKVLSKEIFQESAKELDLDPKKVQQVFKRTDKYTLDEILAAFNNRKFKSERIISKTVVKIIRNFAVDGFCIIVGRAGHLIARDIEDAFHIRFFAPLEYRIRTIMRNDQLSREEAIHFVLKVENERIAFRKAIRDNSIDNDLFDLFINRASFGDDETIDIIEHAIEKKGVLSAYDYKMKYN